MCLSNQSRTDKEALLSEISPKFVWIIRDFTLESVHPETGEAISSKEYLEICLRKKMTSKNAMDNNIIRENIIKYFPDRDCVTMSRPVNEEKDLIRLKDIPLSDLKASFRSEFMNLKKKIFKESQPKIIKGKRLNGPAVANLIISFVDAINQGAIPNINNAFESVIESDIATYYEKSLSLFKNSLVGLNEAEDKETVVEAISEAKIEGLLHYSKVIAINPDTFSNSTYKSWYSDKKRQLEKEMEDVAERIIEKNDRKCLESENK